MLSARLAALVPASVSALLLLVIDSSTVAPARARASRASAAWVAVNSVVLPRSRACPCRSWNALSVCSRPCSAPTMAICCSKFAPTTALAAPNAATAALAALNAPVIAAPARVALACKLAPPVCMLVCAPAMAD